MDFGPVISSYSRKEAIEDGVLVDITDTAREAGFKYPVACTAAVWALIEAPWGHTDINGKLWDIVYMCIHEIKRGMAGDRVYFTAKVNGKNRNFYAVICPGDTPDPVITIMFTDED